MQVGSNLIVFRVFGLLGDAAGAAGQGTVTNTDCLQQATADQAFTNAKAVGSIDGMASALIYRGLERNTASVGLASVLCNETATNPEIRECASVQRRRGLHIGDWATDVVVRSMRCNAC